MSIKKFIEAGWHTVPLQGELKRLSNGTKTIPVFPKDFKELYNSKKNDKVTELGGVMTGPGSNIIAIDCDSEDTFSIFRALDPKYKAVMHSKGKQNPDGSEMTAGTIIYRYHPEVEENFTVKTEEVKLDYYSTKGFIYLPTKANKTKVTWDELPDIKEAPQAVLALLKALKPRVITKAETSLKGKKWKYHLGPQVAKFVEKKKVTEGLFKVLTPHDFRNEEIYIEKGYMHPDDIPLGRGSEYLSKISAIFGADESIDEELYCKALLVINELFSDPMKRSRLEKTIIEPMVEGSIKVDGVVVWRFNKDWEVNLTNVVTKLNSTLTIFYDMDRKIYYAVDVIDEKVHEFKRDAEIFSFLDTVAIEELSKKELKTVMPLIKVTSSPRYQFGFFGDNMESFNRFSSTIPLSIFKNPEAYRSNYVYPTTILQYFEYLIPDNYMRNYLFKFLRRKLDRFEYSPVILYLLGATGSGKDFFVSIIEEIIGPTAIAKPSAKEFMETHNGWILDKYFVQLDEYGDQLARHDNKELVKGLIKSMSGKKTISVRMMQTDGFPYEHNLTIIMTANKNPLTFDADDRRIALFNTPKALRFQPLVEEMGLETFITKVTSEINDFAYWLSVERENATLDEYMTPPETADKQFLIASKLGAGEKIAYYLKSGAFKEFEAICREYGADDILGHHAEGRIYEDDLFDLYIEMTEDAGTKRGLTMAMKEFDKIPTTKEGSKMYYYKIPNLRQYKTTTMSPIEGDFNE